MLVLPLLLLQRKVDQNFEAAFKRIDARKEDEIRLDKKFGEHTHSLCNWLCILKGKMQKQGIEFDEKPWTYGKE